MSLRGVQKPGSQTVTTYFTGAFREDASEQIRFMTLLRSGR
jgi:GTP cyclohydrolase I